MPTLAAETPVAAVMLVPTLEGLRGMSAAALPYVDYGSSEPDSETSSGTSPLADPVLIGLAITFALLILSWRVGGGKKPD